MLHERKGNIPVFSGTPWLTWWGPISLMIRWLKEETFLLETLTSWGSDASTPVSVRQTLRPWRILRVGKRFCTDVEQQLWICVCTSVSTSVLKDLVMIPVHTKPEDSDKELDELYDVFLNVTKKWATDVRRRLHRSSVNSWHRKWCELFILVIVLVLVIAFYNSGCCCV